MVGAKDMTLANDLAAKSTLYVQVLQPDEKVTTDWGRTVASSPVCHKVGVREAALDVED